VYSYWLGSVLPACIFMGMLGIAIHFFRRASRNKKYMTDPMNFPSHSILSYFVQSAVQIVMILVMI